jgi:hypothetical protein
MAAAAVQEIERAHCRPSFAERYRQPSLLLTAAWVAAGRNPLSVCSADFAGPVSAAFATCLAPRTLALRHDFGGGFAFDFPPNHEPENPEIRKLLQGFHRKTGSFRPGLKAHAAPTMTSSMAITSLRPWR